MRPKKPINEKIALTKAQNICASQEKCISDIRKKLYDWNLPNNEHEHVINELLKDKYIDEQRYAFAFTKDKFTYNKWGKVKIEFALKQKNISNQYIKNALDEIPDSECDKVLKMVLAKKLKTIKESDEYTVKSKLVRFAASKGFENGKIFDVVSKIIKNHNMK